jgi:outer membrane biosynthesis protein TonB
MSEQERNKDKRVGWAVSASIHVLIILLFFLINAWTAPDPPLPEYGIELNFGIEEAGSGYEQPVTQPTPPTVEEQGEPEEQIVEEQEEVVEEQPEPEPVENTAVEELPDSQQEDSPVETKPAEVPKPVAKPVEEVVKETKPVTKPVEQPPKEEPKVEEKKVDSNALYPGSASQGNKENKVGDAGNPDGNVEARALYGKQGGGGGGPSLDLAGWRWDYVPNPNDNSKENGRIVFEIRVDDNGEVIGVRTLEKTVSPAIEQLYRREVEKLTFSPTSDNTIPAPISTGKITFIIQSK